MRRDAHKINTTFDIQPNKCPRQGGEKWHPTLMTSFQVPQRCWATLDSRWNATKGGLMRILFSTHFSHLPSYPGLPFAGSVLVDCKKILYQDVLRAGLDWRFYRVMLRIYRVLVHCSVEYAVIFRIPWQKGDNVTYFILLTYQARDGAKTDKPTDEPMTDRTTVKIKLEYFAMLSLHVRFKCVRVLHCVFERYQGLSFFLNKLTFATESE